MTSRLAGSHVRRLVVSDDPVRHPSISDAFGVARFQSDSAALCSNDVPSEVVVSGEPAPPAWLGRTRAVCSLRNDHRRTTQALTRPSSVAVPSRV